jgi:hypothetical protein
MLVPGIGVMIGLMAALVDCIWGSSATVCINSSSIGVAWGSITFPSSGKTLATLVKTRIRHKVGAGKGIIS